MLIHDKNVIDRMALDLPPVFTAADGRNWLSKTYRAPGKALDAMVKKGSLVRLKRGLYAFYDNFDPLSAAAVLHPPSYVSFETALTFYGMIPERVETVLCVVDGRGASFHTPVGCFIYHSQEHGLYSLGMTLSLRQGYPPTPIATREKALLDTLARAKLMAAAMEPEHICDYVTQGIRITEADLVSLSRRKLRRLAKLYRNKGPLRLLQALERDNEGHHA